MLQVRAFAAPGKFVAIVIEIGKKIITLFIALLVLILVSIVLQLFFFLVIHLFLFKTFSFYIIKGFANALFVLLRDEDPLTIVQSYNGTMTNNNGEEIGNIVIHQNPQPNTNMFQSFITSVLATYFFLGIGWDSVTTINASPALYIIIVLFSK
jgi:hypothetical protein